MFGTGFVPGEADYLPVRCISKEDKKYEGMYHNRLATTNNEVSTQLLLEAVFHLLSKISGKEKHF